METNCRCTDDDMHTGAAHAHLSLHYHNASLPATPACHADDPVAAARLAELQAPLADYTGQVVGEAAATLDGERIDIRNRETNLGDLMCDAILAYAQRHTGLLGGENAGWPAVCLINGGVFRASIPAGNVTQGDCLAVTPYGER